jgi:hypothetical protein
MPASKLGSQAALAGSRCDFGGEGAERVDIGLVAPRFHDALQGIVDAGGWLAVVAVACQWAAVCFGEHDAGVLVEESELVIRAALPTAASTTRRRRPHEVVLRPHVLSRRTETRELRALLPRQRTDSHSVQSVPTRPTPPLARRDALASRDRPSLA